MVKVILNDSERLGCYHPLQDCQKICERQMIHGAGNCVISYFFPKHVSSGLQQKRQKSVNTNIDSLNPSDTVYH